MLLTLTWCFVCFVFRFWLWITSNWIAFSVYIFLQGRFKTHRFICFTGHILGTTNTFHLFGNYNRQQRVHLNWFSDQVDFYLLVERVFILVFSQILFEYFFFFLIFFCDSIYNKVCYLIVNLFVFFLFGFVSFVWQNENKRKQF